MAHAAPSSISVLVTPATVKKELSKTLFLQSLQMPGGTNRTIVTFKPNSPRNVKTNAACSNRNVTQIKAGKQRSTHISAEM